MVSRVTIGRVMLGVGVVGVIASLAALVVGWRLLDEVGTALGRSLTLTGEALEALDSSVAVAQDTVALMEDSLEQTAETTRELAVAFEDGERLLDATADLSEDQIASSLEAVEEALPSLIQVAAVIDRTLTALSAVPFGPAYDPDEPFDQSLRSVQRELRGLPDDVREQAALIRETGANLGAVRDGTAAMADDLAELQGSLQEAAALLRGYASTAAEASELVGASEAGLVGQLRAARAVVVVLALAMAAGQLVPLAIGWSLLRPEAAVALLESR